MTQNLNSHPSGGRDLILLPLLRLYHMIEIYLSSVLDVICWPFSADPWRAGLHSQNQARMISSQEQTLFSCLKQTLLMLRGERRDLTLKTRSLMRDLHSSIGLSKWRFPRHHVDTYIQECVRMSHHHWGWWSIMNVLTWFISLSIHLLPFYHLIGWLGWFRLHPGPAISSLEGKHVLKPSHLNPQTSVFGLREEPE